MIGVSKAVTLGDVTVGVVSISEVVDVNIEDAVAEFRVGVTEAVTLGEVALGLVSISEVVDVNIGDAFADV
jgi:hypothetical protein